MNYENRSGGRSGGPAAQFLDETRAVFLLQKTLSERAMEQLTDAEVVRTAGGADNSVAILMKHVGGNLRSRWTEPFTTDGEKPDRNRDGEFELEEPDVASIREIWEAGWQVLTEFLDGLTPDDLGRTVRIRGEPHTLLRALQRSLVHTAQHAGQIILLAKQWKGAEWQTLSIPRGESAKYATAPPPQP